MLGACTSDCRAVGLLRAKSVTLFFGQYSAATFHVSTFPHSPTSPCVLGGHLEMLKPPEKDNGAGGCGGGLVLGGVAAGPPFVAVGGVEGSPGLLAGPSINVPHIGALPTLKVCCMGRSQCDCIALHCSVGSLVGCVVTVTLAEHAHGA
jgi:hypothetical protein